MTGMNKECEKAARILKGFVEKGKIPKQVLANAKGLAIFSGFRAAMWLAGAGGSGVVIARLSDGTWSAPSAFTVRAGGVGVVYGVDVYDCVCVLNTQEAVEAYTKGETNLSAGAHMAAGPIGGTADLSGKDIKPVWTYTKSRGLYGGVTVDGTVIKERASLNAESYGSKITAARILKGDGATWPVGTHLLDVLRLAEGESADVKVLGALGDEPTPGDMQA